MRSEQTKFRLVRIKRDLVEEDPGDQCEEENAGADKQAWAALEMFVGDHRQGDALERCFALSTSEHWRPRSRMKGR